LAAGSKAQEEQEEEEKSSSSSSNGSGSSGSSRSGSIIGFLVLFINVGSSKDLFSTMAGGRINLTKNNRGGGEMIRLPPNKFIGRGGN